MKSNLPVEVKVWLVTNAGIISAISRQTGRSRSMVYQVLRGAKRSKAIAGALAAAGAPGFQKESSHGKRFTKSSSKKTTSSTTR